MPGIFKDFIQDRPHLSNTFEADDLVRGVLQWRLPREIWVEVEPGLTAFGERCVKELPLYADDAELNPPRHMPYDAWGRRIDRIVTAPGWDKLARVAAEEGLVAIAYERAHGAFSRLHQMAKLYLFHPSSAFFSCPLAMTDGAARVIELHGTEQMKKEAFRHLTTRNPQRFWTSGQWMTERTGGSDVSMTSTQAKLFDDGVYRLSGDKWFTSATTSQMTMALAKVEGSEGAREGLSLFYVELRNREGELRNIRINRLKDKLGTRALPTAELTLDGTPGFLVGGIGDGVKTVSSLLNITRLYNATCSVAAMARAQYLAKDYARRRSAFGKFLHQHPLHLQTLAASQCEFEAVFHLVFQVAQLLGREETRVASPEDLALLRLLTPIAKLWSARQAISLTSEVIESFGGAGYVEDTGLPRLLRDAQVFSIWEGTTNILSLDVLRALSKDQSMAIFIRDIEVRLSEVKNEALTASVARVRAGLEELRKVVAHFEEASGEKQQAGARQLALSMARLMAASLMLEFADWTASNQKRPASLETAKRFCSLPLVSFIDPSDLELAALTRTVYG